MITVLVGPQGQVELDEDTLRHLGVTFGNKLEVEKCPEGRLLLKRVPRTGKISDVFDMLRTESGPSVTIEDMNEIIKKGWAGEH